MNSFHKTKKWKTKRLRILRRDEYLCRECRRYGRSTGATTVHHIYPVEQWPDLGMVNWNLVSLCSKCHDGMHDRANNELTELGRYWAERVSPRLQELKTGQTGTGLG